MRRTGGRPRGSGRVRKATEAALAAARTDDLGCTLAAMREELHKREYTARLA